jgi:hypothetical protein
VISETAFQTGRFLIIVRGGHPEIATVIDVVETVPPEFEMHSREMLDAAGV